MQRRKIVGVCLSGCALVLFALWTVIASSVDLAPIGPNNSVVGLSTLNGWFHKLTGENTWLYMVTDWLGLVPIGIMLGFFALGLGQWIKRKSLFRVDKDLICLGGYYLVIFVAYIAFEYLVVNYRPVLINDVLEASYPSSTTMLVLCVIPTTIMQFNERIKSLTIKRIVFTILILFTIFMVVGRTLSGVHWLSDIIGGILLSVGLVPLYGAVK